MNKHEKKDTKDKPTFEESIAFIDKEIIKRRGKWNLTSLHWMDYDDVSQIIRIHINDKWHLYDASKPLGPWVNRIISNQIKNLIRNNYGNFSRPCLKCEASRPNNGCDIYETQCAECPLYAKWEKTKKSAYEIKIPLALDDHIHEVKPITFEENINLQKFAENLHEEMRRKLKSNEWIVYKGLFVDNKSEEEVAKSMGFKSNEKNRAPGYKQIKNIRKKIIEKVKKCLEKDEVDYI